MLGLLTNNDPSMGSVCGFSPPLSFITTSLVDIDSTVFCQPTKCLFMSHPQDHTKEESNFLAPLVVCEVAPLEVCGVQ